MRQQELVPEDRLACLKASVLGVGAVALLTVTAREGLVLVGMQQPRQLRGVGIVAGTTVRFAQIVTTVGAAELGVAIMAVEAEGR